MNMDLIERLESRVVEMLEQLKALKAENQQLKQEANSSREELEAENKRLREETRSGEGDQGFCVAEDRWFAG